VHVLPSNCVLLFVSVLGAEMGAYLFIHLFIIKSYTKYIST